MQDNGDTLDRVPAGPFVKIYGTIVDSSVWAESHVTRVLWVTMLAIADPEGYVRASVGGLAHTARITISECRAALEVLESPDPDDKSGVDEGRRIKRLQGGWHITNYTDHREMRTWSQVQTAERTRKWRDRLRGHANVTSVTVTPEVDRDREREEEKNKHARSQRSLDAVEVAFSTAWSLYPKRAGGNPRKTALTAFRARLRAGTSPDDLIAGVQRYAAYIAYGEREGTEFVKTGATFFGPGEHWKEDYSLPTTSNSTKKGALDKRGENAWQHVLNVMLPAHHKRDADTLKNAPKRIWAGISAMGGLPRLSNTSEDKRHYLKTDFLRGYHAALEETKP